MRKKYQSVADYLEDQPVRTRDALVELRSIILEAVPEAIELVNYGIPAFALEKGGKRDQQIMMAGYKQHVGLYPHPSAIEAFSDELMRKDYKMGKGSVQFPIDKLLPSALIIRMVRYRKSILDKNQKA